MLGLLTAQCTGPFCVDGSVRSLWMGLAVLAVAAASIAALLDRIVLGDRPAQRRYVLLWLGITVFWVSVWGAMAVADHLHCPPPIFVSIIDANGCQMDHQLLVRLAVLVGGSAAAMWLLSRRRRIPLENQTG